MVTRREMIGAAAFAGGAALLNRISTVGAAALAQDAPRDYTPVHTLNGVTLDFRLMDGVKVMHLIAEEVNHEFAPGLTARCWGYNGRTPGPTIECVAGDRVRIYVTNRLPEPTTVHWHGVRIINGMDGVNGLTQEAIPPGGTFRYEFTLPDAGTFMYHPHFDEMTQQALGMMGMLIVHPRQRQSVVPDRDYVIMLSEWRIDPGASRPVTTEMTDFNVLTMNSKVYPATEPIVASLGERIRIRLGNLGAMDHHPIHLHGFQTYLVESDGGVIPEAARGSANTVLVPVGATRAIEFIADNPGDWPLHCHMTHHTMNQMGHNSPNLIGVDAAAIDKAVQPLLPDYMTMGAGGMGDMTNMRMPAPKNSIPMLGGKGQFGTIDMGGMFTLVKVRDRINGYDDPGDYQFPAGTVATAATAAELRRDGIDVNAI
jgi:manganese oxidase